MLTNGDVTNDTLRKTSIPSSWHRMRESAHYCWLYVLLLMSGLAVVCPIIFPEEFMVWSSGSAESCEFAGDMVSTRLAESDFVRSAPGRSGGRSATHIIRQKLESNFGRRIQRAWRTLLRSSQAETRLHQSASKSFSIFAGGHFLRIYRHEPFDSSITVGAAWNDSRL